MNLVLDIRDLVSPDNSGEYHTFYLTEKKKNIIMDGYFTKLVYSNSRFAMNGVYVGVSITHRKWYDAPRSERYPDIATEDIGHKYYIQFDPYTLDNRQQTERIFDLEERVLDMYVPSNSSKKKVYSLKIQVLNRILKIHTESNGGGGSGSVTRDVQSQYHLKISGVWETAFSYGITYKFTDAYL